MELCMKNILYWLPRILAVLFIAFISVFALDVFSEPQWFVALIMHLIPSFILIGITVIAWRNELIGGILFLAASVAKAIFFHSIFIAAPATIIGILFLISSRRVQA
jgi:hypothetical protein